MKLASVCRAAMSSAVLLGLTAGWRSHAAPQSPDGPIGSVSQPIILGNPASVDSQRTFGLVTIGNRCSGTLVNRYWVLTADHCVASNGVTAGPVDALSNLKVTATWSAATVTPTTVVRYATPDGASPNNPADVALLLLGNGDLGSDRIQLFYVQQVDTGARLLVFGRGISGFATGSGPSAVPAKFDGAYRSATMTPTSTATNSYTFTPNKAGQITAGGDSGGPDIVVDPLGVPLGIAGVHSTCVWTSLPNFPPPNPPPSPWTWVNNITSCTSAALYSFRDDIVTRIQQLPPPVVSQFYPVTWLQNVLYAVRPDGMLLWRRHLMGETQTAPNPLTAGIAKFGISNPRPGIAPSPTTKPNLAKAQSSALPEFQPQTSVQRNWVSRWQGPDAVGTGWSAFKSIIPGGMAELYALAPDGRLLWYRHEGMGDGSDKWSGPLDVGSGWSVFKELVGMGEGVLYGIAADGSLHWYRHTDVPGTRPAQQLPRWWTAGPSVVGSGWQDFTHVFATGQGVLYAITPDGRLLWYRHKGYLTGTSDWSGPAVVGTGWKNFTRVFSSGTGNIYAIDRDGNLYWYLHDGYLDGSSRWQNRVALGNDWGSFVNIFPSIPAPAALVR